MRLAAGTLTVVCAILFNIINLANAHTPSAAIARLPRVAKGFQANLGQAADQVRYLWRGSGLNLFLTREGPVFTVRNRDGGSGAQAISLRLAGQGGGLEPRGLDETPHKVSYFLGRDPRKWVRGIPSYSRVRYPGALPGVDWDFYEGPDGLEFDLVLVPGADPKEIILQVSGPGKVRLLPDESLRISGGQPGLRLKKPRAFQDVEGRRVTVDCHYWITPQGGVGFVLGEYDHSLPLVIDPVITWATHLGGTLDDAVKDAAVDASGNLLVTGYTWSSDFPTTAGSYLQFLNGRISAFVCKIAADGSSLLYSLYLGGSQDDEGRGIAVEQSTGAAWVTGTSTSGDFPLVNPLDNVYLNGEIFVAKVSAAGDALLFSTYLGGMSVEEGADIALDTSGHVWVTGWSSSPDYPTASPLQTLSGVYDVVISRIKNDGTALLFSTYLGGSGASAEKPSAIRVDQTTGKVWVAGFTNASDFPVTTGAFQCAFMGGNYDAFLVRYAADGSSLEYATYLGGSGEDQAHGLALDPSGNPWVTGQTDSDDFPTASPLQAARNGTNYDDIFVSKLAADGSGLLFSTYFGGKWEDVGNGLAVDSAGNCLVAGHSWSVDFPVLKAIQGYTGNCAINYWGCFQSYPWADGVLAKFSADGSSLIFSTYMSGAGQDYLYGALFWGDGTAYVWGSTYGQFPVVDALQGAHAGGEDGLVARIDLTQDCAEPAPPTGFTCTAITNWDIELDWTAAEGSPYYVLQYSYDSTFADFQYEVVTDAAHYTFTPTQEGDIYFRLASTKDPCGRSAWVTCGPSYYFWPENPPQAVSALSLPANSTDGVFTVSWDGPRDATKYRLERCCSADFASPEMLVEEYVKTYQETGLSPGYYYYRVRGYNTNGWGDWVSQGPVAVVTPPSSCLGLLLN